MARRRSRRDVDLPTGSGENGIGNEEEEDTFRFTIQERASELIFSQVICTWLLFTSCIVGHSYVAPSINVHLGAFYRTLPVYW